MQDKIQLALSSTVSEINFTGAVSHHKGKVRDSFVLDDQRRAIVVTDRISAFDFVLGTVPFKGQVLNQIAAWWFKKLDNIVPHHLISVPDPNISLVKNVKPLPVEIIVRAYLTGTTTTSSWYAYQNLDRKICGLEMPAGMKKNQAFATPIITPTTKPDVGHDEALSREEIFSRGLVEKSIYEQAESYALKMFTLGQKLAAERNLILVDTKYEMGIDEEGNLIVIDEVHTPDSSRYWIADSYEDRFNQGQEPEGLDKEFVRKAIVNSGYNVDDSEQNPGDFLTDEIRVSASQKYIELYERMTGEKFVFPDNVKAKGRIEQVLSEIVNS
ncbi:phosphoribosylaminoimidazolesuccinocarboxamide synthase [Candidatus Gracilibacteria bacterium]|nr:phosphoribosylaminoimidazolesuccinocarboxamide synthase [Candidatus Gracilibacteria bacterium]